MNTLIRTGIIIIFLTHYWVNTTFAIQENGNKIYQCNELISIDNILEIPFVDTLIDDEIKENKVWLRPMGVGPSNNFNDYFITKIQISKPHSANYCPPMPQLLIDLPPPDQL